MYEETEVCIAHGRFRPCRRFGPHEYESSLSWVDLVRAYHATTEPDLTWAAFVDREYLDQGLTTRRCRG